MSLWAFLFLTAAIVSEAYTTIMLDIYELAPLSPWDFFAYSVFDKEDS